MPPMIEALVNPPFNSREITWLPSPAKINLFLHICGRLPSGYHQLQSVFQLLDYGDKIGFRLNPNSERVKLYDNIDGVSEKDNLISKAAKALLAHRQNHQGIDIFVQKSLPMGGGIGGGSSNAATVLLTLNYLWQCDLSLQELAHIGLELGADVPVFVHGRSAFAEGVGERLAAIELEPQYYLVATPNVHVSTADIFAHKDLPRDSAPISAQQYSFATTRNDCELLVTTLHSQVANLLQWLIHYAPSRMTGTGASVFAIFNSKEQASKVLQQLPIDVKGFVAEGVNVSPLHQFFKENGIKIKA
ncbi:4-(cytidine 5'-diphospho)-2-C-methyl-D-erythritol kinase [Glaciecola siphonariae]|uniref:4-diphosphocytidyl-2-C-methyl-D-erythritol kinase n=1 Tax=Glaciecola siphonariae TaxID=521012 RepID=A0ABV9LW75_9ALTE